MEVVVVKDRETADGRRLYAEPTGIHLLYQSASHQLDEEATFPVIERRKGQTNHLLGIAVGHRMEAAHIWILAQAHSRRLLSVPKRDFDLATLHSEFGLGYRCWASNSPVVRDNSAAC